MHECAGQSLEPLAGEPELPITGGGCDNDEPLPPPRWDDETHAQHPDIVIFPRGVSPGHLFPDLITPVPSKLTRHLEQLLAFLTHLS